MLTKTNKLIPTKPRIADDDRTRATPIDYGPALDAIEDLTKWAFKLATKDVAGWPEGRERVRNAKRFVLGRLRGKAAREASGDLVFVAGLLARIFEAELALPQNVIVRLLGELELPTDDVPRVAVAPTACPGPVRRYPEAPRRTASEEAAHWFAMALDEIDDEAVIEDELASRRARRASVTPVQARRVG